MTSSDRRQQLLDECMPYLHSLARKWARNTPHEVDDLVQEGALHILETYEHLPAHIQEPRRYLITCAKYRMISVVTHRQYDLSLDAPLTDERGETFLDTLAAPPMRSPDEQPRYADALTRALQSLSTNQQEIIAEYYHLDFPVVAGRYYDNHSAYSAQADTLSALNSRRFRACQKLRANEQLRQAVCS